MPLSSSINRLYLVSGLFDLQKGEAVAGSLEPVSDRILVMSAGGAPSLNMTDERGLIMSIDAKGAQLHPVQRPPTTPLRLAIAPPGTGMASYAAFAKQWQNELVKKIKAAGISIGLTTIPIKFRQSHLRPPQNETENRVYSHFKAGEFQGHLLPRQKCLVVLVETKAFRYAPATISAKLAGKTLALKKLDDPISVALPDKGAGSYFGYVAIRNDLAPGECVVSIRGDHLQHEHQRHNTRDVKRSFSLAFQMQGLFGEMEIQVFEMPSLEASILFHFPSRYPHLLPKPPDDESPAYAAGISAIASARSNIFLANKQRKMVAGLAPSIEDDSASAKSGETEARKGPLADLSEKLYEAFEGEITSLVSQFDATNPRAEAAPVVLAAFQGWRKYQESAKKWKALEKDLLKTAKSILGGEKAKSLFDATVLKTVFHPNAFRESLLRQVEAYSGSGKPLPVRLGLVKVEVLEKELRERFEREAFSRRFRTFEQKALNTAQGSLAVLQVAISIERLASDIFAVDAAKQDKSFQAARLRKITESYMQAYGEAPCMGAYSRIEALRILEDAARAGVDSAESAAVDKAVDLTLDVMSLVPVIREVASLIRLAGAAKDLALFALDNLSDAIDRFWIRHRSTGDRLFELSRQHALNVRALPAWREARGSRPDVEWRSRVIAIIGLLRLIERLGSPHKNPARFKEKLDQYKIKEYIEAYLLADRPFDAFVNSSLPLDEIWLYATGSKDASWNETLAWLRSPLSAADKTMGDEGGYRAAKFGSYPAFPIERFEAPNVVALSRSFALDFSAIVDQRLAWTRVYIKDRKTKKWVGIEQARFAIGPRDPVRVVAVFRAKSEKDDLSGVPVSLQLIRVDGVGGEEGPVYKTVLSKTLAWCASDGEDKELLADDASEMKFANDPLAYVAIFHPFYFYRKSMYRGLKPFGHIPLSDDPSSEVVFHVKAGDDAVRLKHSGKDVRVKSVLNLKDGEEVGMLLNREFLARKTADKPVPNLFKFPYQEIVPLGVMAIQGDAFKICGSKGGTFLLGNEDDPLAWGKSLSLVGVFGARFTSTKEWSGEDLRFPAFWRFREEHFWSDKFGPDYPSDVVFVEGGKPKRSWRWIQVVSELVSRKLLQSGKLAALFGEPASDCPEPMVLCASAVHLSYSIESRDGRTMGVVDGPKPFTKEINDDKVVYEVGLQAPSQVGLDGKLDSFVRITMESLRGFKSSGTSFGSSPAFITDQRYFKLLQIEKI